MSPIVTYFLGFVAAVGVIVYVTHVVWQRQLASLPSPRHWIEAWKYIWCECYGLSWESSPRIVWVRGRSFACSTGLQVAGESDARGITVAVETETTPVSATALAHEAWHCALRAKGLNPDTGHVSAAWGIGGAVYNANARLRERGW